MKTVIFSNGRGSDVTERYSGFVNRMVNGGISITEGDEIYSEHDNPRLRMVAKITKFVITFRDSVPGISIFVDERAMY